MPMQEAHAGNDAQGAVPAGKPSEARGVMVSGRIESKLGLEPSDHRSSKPRGDDELVPVKRARLRRHTPRVSH
jgi:hypothetical protein